MDPALEELREGDPDEEIEAVARLRTPAAAPPHLRKVAVFNPIVTCRVPRRHIWDVWEHPDVLSIKAPRLLASEQSLIDTEAVNDTAVRLTDWRRPAEMTFTGKGVVVGLIDVGCDIAHPNFLSQGRTRLLALWDQTGPATAKSPAPYGYGTLHTADDIDLALRSADPYAALDYHPAKADSSCIGAHGTLCMDIAAGNGSIGSPPGVAPEADLVFVHLSAGTSDIGSNLGHSVRMLEALDFIRHAGGSKPWVVNVSMGRRGGAHDGLTPVEQGVDQALLAAPGAACVMSGGNYYSSNAHASGNLRPGKTRVLQWRVDPADITPNELEVWYSGKDRLRVEVRSPAGQPFSAALGENTAISAGGRKTGHLYHRRTDPNNSDHNIHIFLYKGSPGGIWQISLTAEDVVDGRFHAWVERDLPCPHCESEFVKEDADSTSTTGTVCNGFRSIAVGAYNGHSSLREIPSFSSCGPTRDYRQKPDLIAPGCDVLGARSAGHGRCAGQLMLTRQSGTSFAAPYVTGTIALMFQACRRPLPVQATRRLLLAAADPAGAGVDPLRVGSGYLDIRRAVMAARTYDGETTDGSESASAAAHAKPQEETMLEDRELIESAYAQALGPYEQELMPANRQRWRRSSRRLKAGASEKRSI